MASARRYTTIAEVQQYADVTSTNDTEFEDRISQCEELIDAYVGVQERFIDDEVVSSVTAVNGLTITDTSSTSQLQATDDTYAGCYIEIIGGSGIGNRRWIVSSSYANKSITYEGSSIGADTTSVYRIFQLGKFPRCADARLHLTKYYKVIPEPVKRAVAAQMEFLINQGDAYFGTAASDLQSENIGNYSYSKGGSSADGAATLSVVKLIAPKAKTLLRGYKNITGSMVVDNPTGL